MAEQCDLPLPEITHDDFSRAWTRFELVAKAKEWNDQRQVAIVPTLLRGKLVDYYLDLTADEKETLKKMKEALMEKAGIGKDRLMAGKAFISRCQQPGEKVDDFCGELKSLFKLAYPGEALLTSEVLLQRFLTGLTPSLSRQLLMRGKPSNMEEATKTAKEIEYALNFDERPSEYSNEVNAVKEESHLIQKMQQAFEQISRRLEAIETKFSKPSTTTGNIPSYNSGSQPRTWRNGNNRRSRVQDSRCWECGEIGHIRRNCPQLKESGSARTVGGWPGK